jgi:hypothetical protein
MTRQRIILLLAVGLVALGLWWLLRVPQPAVAMIERIFDAPIAFYGRVVDQNGDPVPDAEVGFKAADKFNAPGTLYTDKSDAAGYFQIAGIKGAGLSVGVGKDGYYPVEGKSSANFGYGMGVDSTRRPPPAKDNPAIFVLHKMGNTEPMTFLSGRQFDVPASGQPLTIDLVTGRANGGGLRVESWLGDASKRPFDWRYQLSIPGGGLVERTGHFDFEAPEGGYQPTVEINMPATAEGWSSRMDRNYFAKLPDGRYARIKIRFYPGPQRNFVVLESYVNPQPGSRNLEYDPNQTANAP